MGRTRSHFPIRGWQWIFYIYGWLTGATNVIFWLILVILHLVNHDKDFFGPQLHKRVFVWGVFTFLATLLAIAAFVLFILLVTPVAMGAMH